MEIVSMYSVDVPEERAPTPGFLVWRLSMKWRVAVDRAVAPLGLTHAEYSVLSSLYGMVRAGSGRANAGSLITRASSPSTSRSWSWHSRPRGLGRPHRRPRRHPGGPAPAPTDTGSDVAERAIAVVRDLQEELTAPLGGIAGQADPEPRARAGGAARRTPSPQATQEKPMSKQTPTLTGQDIGQAERATRALLDAVLAETETTFHQSVVLNLTDCKRTVPGGARWRPSSA